MQGWRKRGAMALAVVTLAGATMGQDSCRKDLKDLQKSSDDLKDVSGENNAKYADRMRQIKIGMTKQEVREIMGERPRDTQVMQSGYGKSETWYYGSY